MKKNLFAGWHNVFQFTLKQGIDNKGFKTSTYGLLILMIVIGLGINVVLATIQKKDATEVSPIENVYVIDESNLEIVYLDSFYELYDKTFPVLSFIKTDKSVDETIKALSQNNPNDVILRIQEDNGYQMTLLLPYETNITQKQGEALLDSLEFILEQSKLLSSGISMDKLIWAMSGVNTSFIEAGEETKSIGEEMVSMLLPMLCTFLMFFMLLVYGLSIGNIVSIEKSSKLMEMLLTYVQPYALIFGKIFAMATIAIMQMILWIGGLVGGFFVGDFIARTYVFEEYQNLLIEIFKLIQNQGGSTAFTIYSIIIAIITTSAAFLFYCVLAGLIASFVSKAEELAQVMGFYQMFILIGFFGAYMLPLQEKDWINTILRIVPLTSAYLLPGDILVGNINVNQGIGYLMILIVTIIILLLITGKIYKNKLFYKGTSLKERRRK